MLGTWRHRRLIITAALLLLIAAGLAAFAEYRYRQFVQTHVDRALDFTPQGDSALRAQAQALVAQHGDQSGHRLLPDGLASLRARLELLDHAQVGINLQYYIWDDDEAGRLVLARALDAADRGVKVRLLLDDFNVSELTDRLAQVALHPNLRIRLFNPSSTRRAYFLNWLSAFARLNRRMHNKVLSADGAGAIIGGRNIQNRYFGLSREHVFRDMDLFATGPAATEIDASFDLFWNSPAAIDWQRRTARTRSPSPTDTANWRSQSANWAKWVGLGPSATPPSGKPEVLAGPGLTWAPSMLLVDSPDIDETAPGAGRIAKALARHLPQARQSIDVEAGYFILTEEAITSMVALIDKGVRVSLLSNSLRASESAMIYGGYWAGRDALIRQGQAVRELRGNARLPLHPSVGGAQPQSTVHSKLAVIDARYTLVGSFNFDPRSANLNTEIMLLIDSPALAEQALATMRTGWHDEHSYRLLRQEGQTVWVDGPQADAQIHTITPGATWLDQVVIRLVRYLPARWLL